MKNLNDIWQEYINHNTLSTQTLNDLIWHIENDDTSETVVMVTDILIKECGGILTKKLVPYIAKQLDHEDEYVRELAVSSIVRRLKLAEYAEKALNMAKNDSDDGVRDRAAGSLGAVINKIDFNLRKQIAIYLYDVMVSAIYDDLHKQSAYDSILEAMEVPINLWPAAKLHPDILNMIDNNLLEKFKTKYNINDAA
ncbi:MAG: HEAT repeat domain-containing protein [Gammaproteobacteria bacterium]